MKWIGQSIVDFIARFRSDVYLESISSGTIASGGNLGLDSNNKVVKATEATGDITGVTAGTNLTGGGTSGGVTINLADASTSAKGAASFASADFSVSSGAVSLGDDVIKDVDTDSGSVTPTTHTISIVGGAGVGTAGEDETVTISGTDASTSAKGVASFSSNNFSVSSGAVSLATAQTWASPVITTDQWNFESANSTDPLVIIKNTTNDALGGRLRFLNSRGADGQDGDEAGKIQFYSYDDGTPSGEEYAAIKATIHDATSGEESGKLELQVASHDGGTETGLTLNGGSVDAEVDVTVGRGLASVTTIAGNLTSGGTITGEFMVAEDSITADNFIGQYVVLRCSAFYTNDVPMVQNNLYFGNSVGHQPMNWNDPAPVGGAISSTSSFTIGGDDENWGIVLPFNISKIEVQCSLRPQLGVGTASAGDSDSYTVAIYTGVRSTDSSADLTLTKVAHNTETISDTINRYTQNDVDYTGDLNKGTMIYVGVGTEDSSDMKNGRGYMNITVIRR